MAKPRFFLRETEILKSLCNGLDPISGDVLDTPKSPELDGLRLELFAALKKLDRKTKQSVPAPLATTAPTASSAIDNSGRNWTRENDRKLVRLWQDSTAPNLTALAREFQRSPGGISARLVHLKVASSRQEVLEINIQRTQKVLSAMTVAGHDNQAKKIEN